MTFAPGQRLGPYEIVAAAGAGGMGEVYRARDTRLGRTVAIKVLPAEFTADARLRVRLEREAKAISTLTHPNICTLYDVGRDNEVDYLVMEYCEGETLADRLRQGPIPLSDAARIGAEIASALDGAHRQGIVHGDVKPGNVILVSNGARLLDFGLARHRWRADETESLSGTRSEPGIAGTIAYMAPELLQGSPPDARSDIWSLGSLVYEIAAGEPPFARGTRAELIASIVTRDPDLDRIEDPSLRHVVRKCLRKNPERRWQSARDLAGELLTIAENGTVVRRRRFATGVLYASTVAALLLAIAAGWLAWESGRDVEPARLSVAIPSGMRLSEAGPAIAFSPDGRELMFSVRGDGQGQSVYSRRLDEFQPRRIARGYFPIPSPDGTWILSGWSYGVVKTSLESGAETPLAALVGPARGYAVTGDGTVYFARGHRGGLWKVPADGSGPEQVTTPDESRGENSHRWPHLLPDGRHLLFTIRTDKITTFSEAQIAVLSLETGIWRTVLDGGTLPTYVPTGHLLFVRQGSLMAVPFDLERLTVRGRPTRVIDDVLDYPSTGGAQYAVSSRTGMLAFVSAAGEAMSFSRFEVVDRTGSVTATHDVQRTDGFRAVTFRAAPDGRRLAIHASAANDQIWIYDLERSALSRLTTGGGEFLSPFWSPDSTSVLFTDGKGILRQLADGSSEAKRVVRVSVFSGGSCSPGCERIAFVRSGERRDVWVTRTADDPSPSLFVGGPSEEMSGSFAPNGRSIAYASDESGIWEVYVRPVVGQGRAQVSAGGGSGPRWSRDGREIYYRAGDGFYAVDMNPDAPLDVGKPRLLFRFRGILAWDVLGDRFILLREHEPPFLASAINIIPGWLDDLEERVPAR